MGEYKATILRGKRKGEIIDLHQWCNDWATDSDGRVWALGALEFGNVAKRELINQFQLDKHENTSTRTGQMFWFYYNYTHFLLTGRFKRQKREKL